jgi:HEAT repeat protein
MRWLFVIAIACSSPSADDDVRAQVTLLLNQEGAPARAASERLVHYGRRAIPTIEAAMHTASPSGRKNLILALRQIGDEEAIPLLRHIAAYEADPDVRREAEWTLKKWAQESGPRAEKARAALRAVDEARSREEAG